MMIMQVALLFSLAGLLCLFFTPAFAVREARIERVLALRGWPKIRVPFWKMGWYPHDIWKRLPDYEAVGSTPLCSAPKPRDQLFAVLNQLCEQKGEAELKLFAVKAGGRGNKPLKS